MWTRRMGKQKNQNMISLLYIITQQFKLSNNFPYLLLLWVYCVCICGCVCMCLCVYVSDYACLSTYTCVEARGQPWVSHIPGSVHPASESMFLIGLASLIARLTGQWVPGILLSSLPQHKLAGRHHGACIEPIFMKYLMAPAFSQCLLST